MASIIENSLKEYQDFLDGKDTNVEVIETSIPIRPEFDGNVIKNLRKQINVTQKGLAGLIGVSPRTLENKRGTYLSKKYGIRREKVNYLINLIKIRVVLVKSF